jgi:hypothetical protein
MWSRLRVRTPMRQYRPSRAELPPPLPMSRYRRAVLPPISGRPRRRGPRLLSPQPVQALQCLGCIRRHALLPRLDARLVADALRGARSDRPRDRGMRQKSPGVAGLLEGSCLRRRFGVTSVATTGCDRGSAVEKLGFRPAEMAAWPARNSDHRLEARGLHHDSLGEAARHHHGKSGGAAHRARLSPGGRRADDLPGRPPGSQHRR